MPKKEIKEAFSPPHSVKMVLLHSGALGVETPNAVYPLWPYASDYDLHEKAGGLPLCALAAPNVRIKMREVCNRAQKLCIPIK